MFKIIWAIDAFHSRPKAQLRSLDAIEAFFGKEAIEVTPVSTLPLGRYDSESFSFLNEWHALASVADKKVKQFLKAEKRPYLKPHRLLRQEHSSLSEAVAAVVHFAIQEKADAIVTSSHGRTGTTRFMLGSFSETLLYQSPVPVCVVNPKMTKIKRITSILFATDFSDASKRAFQKMVKWAKKVDVEVVLFHKLQFPISVEGLPPLLVTTTPSEYAAKLHREAEVWTKWAEGQGANARVLINKGKGAPYTELEREAKKLGRGTLIALAAQSGGLESMLLGSFTRKVARTAGWPVLVVRSEEDTLAKKFLTEISRLGYAYTAQPLMT